MHASALTKLLPLPQMGVSEICQVVLTLLSHSTCSVRASFGVELGQEVALELEDMDMRVPSRWCACVRECDQAMPFEVLDRARQQTCNRLGWTAKCFAVKDAMISTIRMRCDYSHSVIVQVDQVGRWNPSCVQNQESIVS